RKLLLEIQFCRQKGAKSMKILIIFYSIADSDGSRQPSANELAGARFQGEYVARIAAKLAD
ncbi:MAG: hypothetical protein ACOCUB_00835, partial [Desulfohalobiaceae bacterium]